MFRSTRSFVPAPLAAALLLIACGDDPAEPRLTMTMVAGEYVAEQTLGAITFTTTEGGETIDWLERGASLTITLATDGTTEGRLFVPGMDEDGGDFDADLTGAWTLVGDTVRFSHAADTFVRDMPFVVRDGRLEGDRTFGGTRIRVVLVKR